MHSAPKGMMMPCTLALLESEISIMLLCQLCSIRYTAVRVKNRLKSTSVIKVAIMNNMDDFHSTKEAITCYHQIDPYLSTKMN